ncbi:MAG TPA: DUF1330 domain-containing protein [Candidatus Binataceae bacterium]|nr:DUF1330 domain-containing protein [Candidatus Binataceae bacterium]
MAAYAIFIRESTRDPKELEIYSKAAPATLAGHKVTPRVVYGKHEVVEGPQIEGAVVLEFPTFEEAKAWYDSPAYREAREHRFKGANYRAFILQGI